MKKLLLIMNAVSGMRRACRYLADIISVFNRAGYEVSVYVTAGPGDATREAQEKAPQVDLIVCCGGDGTFNETVSGILRSGVDVPVGYIPSGSTNDFAASLRLSANFVQAAEDIAEGEPVSYDVGRFGSRIFTYIASFGAFTKVSYNTPQSFKNVLGHTAYVLESINELSQIRKTHVRMELDGQVVEDDFIFGAISNSTSVGGILTLDPKRVDMADGMLEVLLVRAPVDLIELSECLAAMQSQKYDCAMITFRSAKKIRVYADPEMIWTLDGEREEGHAQVDVENFHLAFRLMRRPERDV